ncbi:alkaline phosphatase [Larkinella punicea]|uniref:Alkaline phosphatase n=1 Tax=Larkinella punicea TaxID=2315727 RepID=A0A368JSL9_9BACT|nr:alkaline phosphatase [Larkinella punicea]RCR70628.1 alkaline phosphatase [Larkinella punicea]
MKLKHALLIVILASFMPVRSALAQPNGLYTTAQAHSHNDYEQSIPFWQAYHQQFGSIEVDVHAKNGVLYVAHDETDIDPARTLDALYIQPLVQQVKTGQGKIEPKTARPLQLLIDLKTPARQTLPLLVQMLAAYPNVFGSGASVQVVVSGNVPEPEDFKTYPDWLLFDGRPEITYSPDQLKHIGLISQSFLTYTRWNGKGLIVSSERKKLNEVIRKTHQQGKKLRLWATPDNINTWKTLINLGVDYINTDHITELANFLNSRPTAEYRNKTVHAVYQPTYRQNDALSRVKNVILLIGDGMGLAQIYAGITANQGQLNLTQVLNLGFSKTSAADTYITDSAAGATAMATGEKTNNRAIGVDSTGKARPAIPALIKPWNMVSGLISAGSVTDATPAAFYGHQPDRSFEREIAADFLQNPVQILIGGGYRFFNEEKVLDTLRQRGYAVADRFGKLAQLKAPFVLLDDESVVSVGQGRKDFLTTSLRKTLAELSPNPAGFFVMAEGAQIDYGGHANDVRYVVQEMLDFDQAVGEALKFADQNGETLVIVTADHETGGLTLLDGDLKRGYVDGHFSTNDHSGVMVPVFAYGPHSLDFRGVYENTAIHHKIMAVLGRYRNTQKTK